MAKRPSSQLNVKSSDAESLCQERSQTICVCLDCVMKYLSDFEKNKDSIVTQSNQLLEEKDEPADINKNLHAK